MGSSGEPTGFQPMDLLVQHLQQLDITNLYPTPNEIVRKMK
jgi:hypothetical protein